MKKTKLVITATSIISFFLLCRCTSNPVEGHFLSDKLRSATESYVDNAVDQFSNELESAGGFFMWNNYLAYLGLVDKGFKERMHDAWQRSYDPDSLEAYLRTQLAKENPRLRITINKDAAAIENYSYILFLPFLSIAVEELLIYFIAYLLMRFVAIPLIAKYTAKKTYKSESWLGNFVLSFLSSFEHQARVKQRAKKVKSYLNNLMMIFVLIFTLFYYDFNGSLNTALKEKIKSDLLQDIQITQSFK